ncbi:MAG: hypothetical protein IPJ39_19820 [Saprospiraceae bacterium]|nr:hypothetical protein [Saprospiraceae bacterium]
MSCLHFVELVDISLDRNIDFSKVTSILEKEHIKKEIEKIEVFYNQGLTELTNLPNSVQKYDLEGQKQG